MIYDVENHYGYIFMYAKCLLEYRSHTYMYVKDINLIRTFWAVANTGSFSQAAKKLQSTQPTVTRQIQTLESQTGLHLFDRSNLGLVITDSGKKLVESANEMMAYANKFNLQVAGQEDVLRGEVRISANEIVGIHLLPPAITALREKYPEVQVELDISNANTNLSKRDADIAFRMQAPTNIQLVGKRLPNLPLGIYGHRDLVKKLGDITSMEALLALPLIGFDKTNVMDDALKSLGLKTSPQTFDIRCDNIIAQTALIRAGAGLGVMQHQLAKCYPEVLLVDMAWKIPDLEFWLICHQDVQYSKTIQLVMRFFGDWFQNEPYASVLT
jgi:DNA-binding transcriptional LysR family regulator